MPKRVSVHSSLQGSNSGEKIFEIFKNRIKSRSSLDVIWGGRGDWCITLEIDGNLSPESYRIEQEKDGRFQISGGNQLGLLYGIGKLLRMGHFTQDDWFPGLWEGSCVPQKKVRGIYLATHFHNYYHDAPLDEVREYMEDLVLWGANTVLVWFDMHHYHSTEEPEAVEMIERLKKILGYAKELGLKTAITMIANEAFADSPNELRADWTGGHDGYTTQLAGHYHVELCPNKPGAMELLLKWHEEVLNAFVLIDLDYVNIWPYDQGGCTCGLCKPWGANGFLKAAKPLSDLVKKLLPSVEIILSTWLFDHFTPGEWDGLDSAFQERPAWVDYILFDHPENSQYPMYIANGNTPDKPDFLGFPEISMYGAVPWGGFGANPMPNNLERLWNRVKDLQQGGFPYSEGIFEDINKVIFLQLYWGEFQQSDAILKEYIRYELCEEATVNLLQVFHLMEESIPRQRLDENGNIHDYPCNGIPWAGEQRFVIEHTCGIEKTYSLLTQIDARLSKRVKASWRWRIIYLRAVIDYQLFKNDFKTNDVLERAYWELTELYYAKNGDYCVTPPTLESIEENRGGFSWF